MGEGVRKVRPEKPVAPPEAEALKMKRRRPFGRTVGRYGRPIGTRMRKMTL